MSTTTPPPAATGASYRASEHTLTLADGTELFYRAWLPPQPTSKTLVIFHRGHELPAESRTSWRR
jgi:alpha-beta hydrolase superfamily lysophospholipase